MCWCLPSGTEQPSRCWTDPGLRDCTNGLLSRRSPARSRAQGVGSAAQCRTETTKMRGRRSGGQPGEPHFHRTSTRMVSQTSGGKSSRPDRQGEVDWSWAKAQRMLCCWTQVPSPPPRRSLFSCLNPSARGRHPGAEFSPPPGTATVGCPRQATIFPPSSGWRAL